LLKAPVRACFAKGAQVKVTKETFLTRRWNTIISLAQGVPTLLYAIYGLVTPLGDTLGGMIGLSVLGALF
jgi:hypothetical protein